ncbi:hypothetical protein J7I80_05775 [Bacillus sp. ISL-41]|uniref:hypothetical protein n=1 Tax=Bacillus sp. ISL-41 TaxID=2819127 RepID=UPI001BE9B871|nr:hypothetical protein [Bacillus sp. ISL-41]MBT2641724.1 hypothetical protein [Bacillus sp. ISL-41]
MSTATENMPIYDERVNEIIRSLSDGITRDELAVKYKHRDYRSLDMYMRRRNFTWDSEEKNYKPVTTRIKKSEIKQDDIHKGKASRIIQAFKDNSDAKTIAQEYGFADHRELAEYMTNRGYEWHQDLGNYVRKTGIENIEEFPTKPSSSNEGANNESTKARPLLKKDDELLVLVKTLYEKIGVAEDPIVDQVPRYLVSGIAKTKSVQLSHLLHQLLEDFSYEKNITQRQILETAIIDFFRKYGYKHEVDTLLSR